MDECNCTYPGYPARCRCSARYDDRCDYCDWQWDHECEGNEDGEDREPARD